MRNLVSKGSIVEVRKAPNQLSDAMFDLLMLTKLNIKGSMKLKYIIINKLIHMLIINWQLEWFKTIFTNAIKNL